MIRTIMFLTIKIRTIGRQDKPNGVLSRMKVGIIEEASTLALPVKVGFNCIVDR